MELDTHLPSHCTLVFLGNPLEYLHAGLRFVVHDMEEGGVDETNTTTSTAAGQSEEHHQANGTSEYNL